MSGNIIPLDKKRFGRNNAMTFEETLYDVTTKMDERAFYLMNYASLDKEGEPLEEIVRLTNITVVVLVIISALTSRSSTYKILSTQDPNAAPSPVYIFL